MQIEKVGDSIRDLVEKNEFLKMVMGVSDYIIYGYTFLLVLSKFISLGGFVDALLNLLLFPLIILAFAGKKYIGMIVLFSGQAFASLYGLILDVYYLTFTRYFVGNAGNIWDNIFGVVAFGLLLWLSIALFLKSRPAKPVQTVATQQTPAPVQQPMQQSAPQVPVIQQAAPVQQAPAHTAPQPAAVQSPYVPSSQPVAPQSPAQTPSPAQPAPQSAYAPVPQPAASQAPAVQQPVPQPAASAVHTGAADPYAAYRPHSGGPSSVSTAPASTQEASEPGGSVTPSVICPQCGALLPEGAAFCTKCGRKLGE